MGAAEFGRLVDQAIRDRGELPDDHAHARLRQPAPRLRTSSAASDLHRCGGAHFA